MIIIKKNDNIFDIITKIKNYETEKRSITISFPFGHDILYNKIDLKSIIQVTDKKIIIKTNDILSKKLGKQLGIKYNIVESNKTPKNKKDLLKYNYSFIEYLLYEIKSNFNKSLNFIFKRNKTLDPRRQFLKHYKQKSHITIFVIILIITITIFTYIFLFSLNKTYVYITPNIQVKTKTQNFVFDTKNNGPKSSYIELKTFEDEIQLKEKISTTGLNQKDKNKTRGKVTFYNKLTQDVRLVPKTRLEREDGIIYETIGYIKIPAAKKGEKGEIKSGKIEAEIISRVKDKYGKAVGKRANIKKEGIVLILPGLKEESRSNIFAKTSEKINNGKDDFEKVVGEDDIENAKKFFTESMKKEVTKKLVRKIQKENEESNIKYKVLGVDNIYKYYDIKINIPEMKAGDKIRSFYMTGSIKAKTYAFKTNSITSKLKKSIERSILPEKEKLLYINNKSITIFPEKGVIYRIEEPFQIKATLEIEYNVEYDFKKENDNYIQRLKQTIAGLPKEKAENILINESVISNANIKIRPFFVKSVSKYLDNIEFKTKK